MATFTQPINREADLKAIMDGYEQAIQKESWLSEAFQKDGIQNAWGARKSSKGKGWEAKVLFYDAKIPVIMLEDAGTYGLTGDVPKDEKDEIRLLEGGDKSQRLCRFLSSNWSVKTDNALGSRGRGKMVFIGSSKTREMYFESVKSDDGTYVFGRTYLDNDKTMKVDVFEGSDAHRQREAKFGGTFPELKTVGTRVLIPNPAEELIEAISNGQLAESIQLTWWEILSKHNAKITVGTYENPTVLQCSPWLPVENSGLEKHKTYEDRVVDKGLGLKIKRIHFAFLQDKEVPLNYQGIAIQRRGMNIQMFPFGKLLSGVPEGKVYGSVEFDRSLDDAMLELESAEHYSFSWYKGVATKVLRELKAVAKDFAKEFKILEDERGETSKERKEAESAVQRELNDIAKSLGLSGLGIGTKPPKHGPVEPQPEEPILISIPDFKTPQETGQVNIGQQIKGALALAYSAYEEQLKVSFQIWVYREGGLVLDGLKEVREGVLGRGVSTLNVGWVEISIDGRFTKGKYFLKAKLIALENRTMDDGREIEKGDVLYREVSRPFWVEEEPPAKGFFKEIRSVKKPLEKSKYFWWEYEDGHILYYNSEHPRIKEALEDAQKYREIFFREGAFALWSIVLNTALANPAEVDAKVRKLVEGVDKDSIEEQLKWLIGKCSETIWGK